MEKKLRTHSTWKKAVTMLVAVAMLAGMIPAGAFASTSTAKEDGTYTNPVIYSDVPDPDVIRVGDTFYMSSTTMHLSPGCPIMKSKDLVNWEIVNYVYDTLDDSDAMALRKGQNAYGKGSWASSLRYNNGTFYVAFASYTTGKTHIYQTKDIENGSWKRSDLDGVYHDLSLLFDDDGRVYLVYGGGTIKVVELTSDATAIKEGGMQKTLIEDASLGLVTEGGGLVGEGAHIQKINGKYYIFIITWPSNSMRTELCFRADKIDGNYEGKIVLQDKGNAQGGIVDTPAGDWYGFVFQDTASVGRIPILVPVTWTDGWPMMGVNGKVPESAKVPVAGQESKSIVVADEFYQSDVQKEYSAAGAVSAAANIEEIEETDPMVQSTERAAEAAAETEGMNLIANGGFEDGVEPWKHNDTANVQVVNDVAVSGTNSMLTTGRKTTSSGPMQDITGKVVPGRVYRFSAKVKYMEGVESRKFDLCIKNGKDWTGIKDIGSVVAKKGEWATIEGTYKLPEDADTSQTSVFFETSWVSDSDATKEKDLMDFYLDDASFVEESTPNIIVNGGFENGKEPWSYQDPATVQVVSGEAASGSFSMKSSERTKTSSGPKQMITGKVSAGGTYEFSAKVKYLEGDSSHGFNLCIQHGASWQGIKVMGSVSAKKGEWSEIKGSYTVPTDADLSQTSIFLETAWAGNPGANDLMDFYADDVVMTEKNVSLPGDSPIAGENDYNGSDLKLEWQWNHNPENNGWSLTERNGYLRLKNTTMSEGVLDARNTLTQRTYGPECSGNVAVDVSKMKNGDVAGLVALQNIYGYVGVKMENNQKSIVMVSGKGTDKTMTEVEKIACTKDTVYLKIDFDFKNRADQAYFFYSLDGINWTKIGNALSMTYDLAHFMGYRFGLFNYATKATGGYVDFDYFRVDDKMTGAEAPANVLKAELLDVNNVSGVQNSKVDVPLTMDALPAGTCKGISASVMIPDCLDVTGVTFNDANLTGTGSYTYKNKQLTLQVAGDTVNFTNASTRLFATIHLKVNKYMSEDTNATLKTDYIRVSGSDTVYNTSETSSDITLKAMQTNALAKKLGNANPLMDTKFGADPYAISYNGRLYVYMTNDSQQYDSTEKDENGLAKYDNNYGNIATINVISSADMVNWTDHGAIPVAGKNAANNPNGIAKWSNNSWAPAACHKVIDGKDKFFLYFADNGSGIGVLEADSPIGPFKEPATGSRLIAPGSKPAEGVTWLFDPAVLVDDDGSGYLYFGGGIPGGDSPTQDQKNYPGTGRVIKLKDNMVEVEGDAVDLKAPGLFEDSGIHKYNNKYYYTYCSNFSNDLEETGRGKICAMVSDSPMGPFTFIGAFLDNPSVFFGVGGNNHHAVFEFGEQWYIIYHAQTLGKAMGVVKGYRSTHINEIDYFSDGTIKNVQADMKGISQLKHINPYERVEAEAIGWQSGVATKVSAQPGSMVSSQNMQITNIQKGDWIAVGDVDFGKTGAAEFMANAASKTGAVIEIRLDDPEAQPVATLNVEATNAEDTFKLMNWDVECITGVHNLFFTFQGDSSSNLIDVDYWSFTQKSGGAEQITVTYQAGEGGSIQGDAIQTIEKGADTKPVTAAAKEGYTFKRWSDGVTTAVRSDTNVTESKTVTAEFEKKQVTEDVRVGGVSLSKKTVAMEMKKTVQLKATVSPSNAKNRSVVWKSSNSSIAAVDKYGKVTSKKPGTATITVTTVDNKKTAVCKVTVSKPAVKLNYSSLALQVKKSTTVVGIRYSRPAGEKIKSAKSDKKGIVSISVKNGKLTLKGVKTGTAVISITSTNGAVVKVKISVQKKVSTKKLALAAKNITVKKGRKVSLKPIKTPVTSTDRVTYKSSNSKIAAVSKNGVITGKKKGKAVITAVSNKKKATCKVTVK